MILGLLGTVWFLIPVCTGLIINIGNITGVLVFATLFLCSWQKDRFAAWIAHMRSTASGSTVLAVILTILIMIFCTAGYLGYEMTRAALDSDEEDRTLVLLGCGVYGERPSLMLVERMQKAKQWMDAHPDSVCIVSGGQGPGESITEAEAMYRWLTARGISPQRLYQEGRSTSTRENLQYSLEIIRSEGLPEKIRIVTNEFHEFRAGTIAGKLHLDHTALPAPTAWWLFPTYVVREMYAILYERFF